MQKNVTLVRRAGHVIPDDLINHLVGKYTAGIGVAVVDKGVLTLVHLKEPPSLEGFKAIQEQVGDNDIIINLMNNGGDELVHDEDLQPFIICKDKKGQPLLIACLDGNFEQFLKADSTRSPESFAVEHLRTKLNKVLGWVGGDMQKVMNEIKSDDFTSDALTMLLSDRGSITYMTNTGLVHTHVVETDKTHKQFDWGWLSNLDGFGVAEKPVTPVGLAGRLSAALTGSKKAILPGQKAKADAKPQDVPAAPATKPDGDSKPDNKPAVTPNETLPTQSGIHQMKDHEGKTQATVINVDMIGKAKDFVIVPIPTDLNGKDKKKFIQKMCEGFLPETNDWWKATAVRAKRAKVASHHNKKIRGFAELGMAISEVAPKAATALPGQNKQQVQLPKKPPPDNKEGPIEGKKTAVLPGQPKKVGEYPEKGKNTTPAHVVADGVPVISPAQRAGMRATLDEAPIKQAIDRHSKVILDPTKFKELEQEIASFVEQMGLDVDEVDKWPFTLLTRFCQEQPEAAAVGWFSALIEKMKAKQDLKAAEQLLHEASADRISTTGVEEKNTGVHSTSSTPKKLNLPGQKKKVA